MKKLVKITLFTAILSAMLILTTFAKLGDVIGYAKYTDISAYINHYPITSYNINGNTAVVAEDLANYGFNVVWNNTARTLTVTRSGGTTITPYGTVYKYSSKVGQNSFPIYETDIVTYVNNVQVDSFAIGGKTCVYIDSLAPYGELNWVPEQRATKLWISGLPTKTYAPLPEEGTAVASTTPGSNTTGYLYSTSYSTLKNALITKGKYYNGTYSFSDNSLSGKATGLIGYDTKKGYIFLMTVYNLSDDSISGTYIVIEEDGSTSGIFSLADRSALIKFSPSGAYVVNSELYLKDSQILTVVNGDLNLYDLLLKLKGINVKLCDFGIYY